MKTKILILVVLLISMIGFSQTYNQLPIAVKQSFENVFVSDWNGWVSLNSDGNLTVDATITYIEGIDCYNITFRRTMKGYAQIDKYFPEQYANIQGDGTMLSYRREIQAAEFPEWLTSYLIEKCHCDTLHLSSGNHQKDFPNRCAVDVGPLAFFYKTVTPLTDDYRIVWKNACWQDMDNQSHQVTTFGCSTPFPKKPLFKSCLFPNSTGFQNTPVPVN